MSTTSPEPAASPLSKFNPGWVGAIVLGVSVIGLWGGLYFQVGRHDVEIDKIMIWKTAKDVGDAELKKDVTYIKDDARQMKESQLRMEAAIGQMANKQQPQIVYLPMPQNQQGASQQRAGTSPP